MSASEPPPDCPLCPRLVAFRHEAQARYPQGHNAPVPGFGALAARLLIVGLAPGLQGANRTGRPFTGDWAGDLLYATLDKFGFSTGTYDERPDDGLTLVDARIVNAVRCVPPANKPLPIEMTQCRTFLAATFNEMDSIRIVVALGRVAHEQILRTWGVRLAHHPFAHGAQHELSTQVAMLDSYHCSRYNTNTGVLTTSMFEDVFARARLLLAP